MEDIMLMINEVQLSRLRVWTRQGEKTRIAAAENQVVATVAAIFADNTVLLLRLRNGETLGDLSKRLAECGRRHGGTPLYVRVTYPSQFSGGHANPAVDRPIRRS
jgi:hypothetical protein